jgi:serine/threonine-protein kinase RsbT
VSGPTLDACEMPIAVEDDIVLVRRRVRDLAQTCKFTVFATSAITTASSELARNVWIHAGGGRVFITKLTEHARTGIRVDFNDEGPGISDLARALAGGYSTAKSMGLGLSGSRRLVDEFVIESVVGRGTKIAMVKWTTF